MSQPWRGDSLRTCLLHTLDHALLRSWLLGSCGRTADYTEDYDGKHRNDDAVYAFLASLLSIQYICREGVLYHVHALNALTTGFISAVFLPPYRGESWRTSRIGASSLVCVDADGGVIGRRWALVGVAARVVLLSRMKSRSVVGQSPLGVARCCARLPSNASCLETPSKHTQPLNIAFQRRISKHFTEDTEKDPIFQSLPK